MSKNSVRRWKQLFLLTAVCMKSMNRNLWKKNLNSNKVYRALLSEDALMNKAGFLRLLTSTYKCAYRRKYKISMVLSLCVHRQSLFGHASACCKLRLENKNVGYVFSFPALVSWWTPIVFLCCLEHFWQIFGNNNPLWIYIICPFFSSIGNTLLCVH